LQKYISDSDALLFLGDMSYDLSKENGEKGNDFFEFAMNVTSSIPFQITPGNHETFNDFEDFKKRLIMPNKQYSDNLYYSYDIGNAHFVSLNSEVPFLNYTDDYISNYFEWIKQDLEKSDKKWKIVTIHRPLYCSAVSNHCEKSAYIMKDFFEDIFYNGKVDLVLTGHLHSYERLLPIYNNEIDYNSVIIDTNIYFNPRFPTYVTCGTGGNRDANHMICKLNFFN